MAAGKASSVSGFVQHAVGVALDDVAGWGAVLAEALVATGGPVVCRRAGVGRRDPRCVEAAVTVRRLMNGLTLDAGALIALDRDDRRVVVLLARASQTGTRITVPASRARAVHPPTGAAGSPRASRASADHQRRRPRPGRRHECRNAARREPHVRHRRRARRDLARAVPGPQWSRRIPTICAASIHSSRSSRSDRAARFWRQKPPSGWGLLTPKRFGVPVSRWRLRRAGRRSRSALQAEVGREHVVGVLADPRRAGLGAFGDLRHLHRVAGHEDGIGHVVGARASRRACCARSRAGRRSPPARVKLGPGDESGRVHHRARPRASSCRPPSSRSRAG